MRSELTDLLTRDAFRIRAGERVAMRRWLAKEERIMEHSLDLFGTADLIRWVRKHGGDPEALRLKGRKWIVEAICKERRL